MMTAKYFHHVIAIFPLKMSIELLTTHCQILCTYYFTTVLQLPRSVPVQVTSITHFLGLIFGSFWKPEHVLYLLQLEKLTR